MRTDMENIFSLSFASHKSPRKFIAETRIREEPFLACRVCMHAVRSKIIFLIFDYTLLCEKICEAHADGGRDIVNIWAYAQRL